MEEIQVAETRFRLIRLPQYEDDLEDLRRIESRLHDSILAALKTELESGKLDEVKGTGGWVKGRAASPSRNIGKSGGFRFIYLAFRVQGDLYLQGVYDHRSKTDLTSWEKNKLKMMAEAYKKAYDAGGGRE